MEASIENAVAPFRQQIAELQEFGVTYQTKFAGLEGVVKEQRKEIRALKKQLLDLCSHDDGNADMPHPPMFNGDCRHNRGFLNQCRIYIQM